MSVLEYQQIFTHEQAVYLVPESNLEHRPIPFRPVAKRFGMHLTELDEAAEEGPSRDRREMFDVRSVGTIEVMPYKEDSHGDDNNIKSVCGSQQLI